LISSQVVKINEKTDISYIYTKFYNKGDLLTILIDSPGHLTQDVCVYVMI